MKFEYKGKTNLTAKVCCDSLPPKEAMLGIIQGVKKNIQCMYVYRHTHTVWKMKIRKAWMQAKMLVSNKICLQFSGKRL